MAVSNYPMYFDLDNTRLVLFANDSNPDYDFMGYDEITAFNFDHIREYAKYTDPALIDENGGFNFVIRLVNILGPTTYLIDQNQQITFNRPLSLSINTPTIYVHTYSILILGILTDPFLKTSHSGCQLKINGNIGNTGGIVAYGTSLQLYSCDIKTNATYSLAALISLSAGKLYNSTLQRGAIYRSSIDVYNVNIIDSLAVIYYAKPTINNLRVFNCSSVTRVRNAGTHDVLMKNSTIQNSNFMVTIYRRARNGVKAEFIDCVSDIWGTKSGYPTADNVIVYVYRKNTVNINVKTQDAAPVAGANLIIKNNIGQVVGDEVSDEKGRFNEIILTVFEWRYKTNNVNNEEFNYNNFTFEIITQEFKKYIINDLEILSPINWVLSLTPIEPKIYINKNMDAQLSSPEPIRGQVQSSQINGQVKPPATIAATVETEILKASSNQNKILAK